MSVSEILGKTILRIDRDGDERLVFVLDDGTQYAMYHTQDCCESVTINDIAGDLNDLIGSPLTMAEESSSQENPPPDASPDSFTWTFYKFATVKGYVTIRWYGESNGYYSESVNFDPVS
jgi:hypothetical protein